jgi:hypothetical protein
LKRPKSAVSADPEDVAAYGKSVAEREESATEEESESVGDVKDGEQDAIPNPTATVTEQ